MRSVLSGIVIAMVIGTVASGCGLSQRWGADPYENPFWARYLVDGDPADDEITEILGMIRSGRDTPRVHNRLGRLLLEKGFPKDAEWEFDRALELDSKFYPAAYNIALSRQARQDRSGAMRALRNTLRIKPGHAAAHFQLGMMFEEDGDVDRAIDHYAKAYTINRALLDPQVNPRVVDTKLVDLTLLALYRDEHVGTSIRTEPSPDSYPVYEHGMPSDEPEAPSDVEAAVEIVTPAPGPTEQPQPQQ